GNARRRFPFGGIGVSFRAKEIVVKRSVVVLFMGLWAAAAPAAAQPVNKACFPISELRTWRAKDTRTIYVRFGFDRVIRLDFSNTCSLLAWPGWHFITWTRGSTRACSPVDWKLSALQPPPDNFTERCVVAKMRLLLPSEVDSLPAQYRP